MTVFPLTEGVAVPQVLLPGKEIDPRLWAMVACDQYTSQPEYWQRCLQEIGDAPSTLRLMLPEAWLGTAQEAPWQKQIASSMEEALAYLKPVFAPIYVRRSFGQETRCGLMLALDLEAYDYTPGAKCLIRPTEQTVADRLPPRIAIRRNAGLEMPHAMMLMDDPENRVLGMMQALEAQAPCYDTELLENGGHLQGWIVPEALWGGLSSALESLKQGPDPLLFAVGDGNHSMAAAKAFWQELKPTLSPEAQKQHPARYFLAEVINLYDPGLNFESIHRLITGTDPEDLWQRLQTLAGDGPSVQVITAKGKRTLSLAMDPGQLPLTYLQPALDSLLRPGEKQDFIHGDEALLQLCQKPDALGIAIPPLAKGALFPTVQAAGVLPRKSFSMGEAHQKRYYFECRKIKE